MKITLVAWAARSYDPAPSSWVLAQWRRRGEITPAPERVGAVWYVDQHATRAMKPASCEPAEVRSMSLVDQMAAQAPARSYRRRNTALAVVPQPPRTKPEPRTWDVATMVAVLEMPQEQILRRVITRPGFPAPLEGQGANAKWLEKAMLAYFNGRKWPRKSNSEGDV